MFSILRQPPSPTLFPYTTLFRSLDLYRYLSREFSAESDVVVVLDRRYAERRNRGERRATPRGERRSPRFRDRKSTRLNSSHGSISYAVFCLKKKKQRPWSIRYIT